ncbi:DNA-binding response regulator, partial (plasmid) [Clostridium perfringens]
RYYLCSFTEDIEKALNDALELNSMFRQALSEREVIRATRSAETCYLDKNKQYKYKNETLIELLEITEEYKRRKRIRNKNSYDGEKAKKFTKRN